MRVVIALGGNALLRRGEPLTVEVQRRNVREAAAQVAAIARHHNVVVTHGNGPQVGLLALQAQAEAFPLDVLDAESEGMIGYMVEQELRRHLPDRDVATLLTQVVVAADDPAFLSPTKPIGPMYDEPDARRLAQERGWRVGEDAGGFRRLVPSPAPRRILEIQTIRLLLAADIVVICAGGGGIPVVETGGGGLRGVEAVIDKDAASALLALDLDADALLMLTDVDGVYADWGTPAARRLGEVSPAELSALAFAAGSMAPKVEAACTFVRRGGGMAGIGRLGDGLAVLEGRAGTLVRPPPGRERPAANSTSV